MNVLCPVCKILMEPTGIFYFCPSNNADFLETHAHIYFNDSNKQTYMKIIVSEYCFQIYIDPVPRTVIREMKKINRPVWSQASSMTFEVAVSDQFDFVELITINSVVNLPWDNYSKVRDAIKTYLLFS